MAIVAGRTNDARIAGQGAVALGVLQTTGRLLALIFFVIATHWVSPSTFGRYSTVAAVLVLVGFVSDLGTTAATTKLVSTGANSDQLLSDSLLACLLLGLVAWGAGEAIMALGYPRLLAADFAVLGASLPVDACLTTIIGAMDGSGAIARRAVVSFLRVGVAASTATILVVVTGSIRWAMAGLVMGPVVGLVAAVVYARRLGVWWGLVHLDPRRGWPLIVSALPFAAIAGFSVVNARIDVLVISTVSSRAATARYDVAQRVLEGPLFLGAILAGPMLYLLSRRLSARDTEGAQRAYDHVARLVFVSGLGISVVLTTLSTPIVSLVFGDSYHQAGLLVAILGAQLWLMLICGLQGMVLAALPQMRSVVLLIAGVNAVWVALEVSFILVDGPIGGALSYPVGTTFTLVAFAVFLRRQTGLLTLRLPPLGAIVGTVAAGMAALALRRQPLAIPLLCAGAAYALSLAIFGAISWEEVREVRTLLHRD
jgi:O-antigen/teichoic acid export membrane protein